MRLYNCKADVTEQMPIYLMDANTGEIYHVMGDMLTSYSSVVAFRANDGTVYLLPRHCYSPTTWQHLRKWYELYGEPYPGKARLYDKAVMCSKYSYDGKNWYTY